jgi:hypothetical protein
VVMSIAVLTGIPRLVERGVLNLLVKHHRAGVLDPRKGCYIW